MTECVQVGDGRGNVVDGPRFWKFNVGLTLHDGKPGNFVAADGLEEALEDAVELIREHADRAESFVSQQRARLREKIEKAMNDYRADGCMAQVVASKKKGVSVYIHLWNDPAPW